MKNVRCWSVRKVLDMWDVYRMSKGVCGERLYIGGRVVVYIWGRMGAVWWQSSYCV